MDREQAVFDVRRDLEEDIARLRTHANRLEALLHELPKEMSLAAAVALRTLIERGKAG